MIHLKLAFRNVFRNKRRTILTLLGIICGNAAIINYLGYVNASIWGMRESVINGQLSHIQIYKKGFLEKGVIDPYKYMIDNYEEIKKIMMEDKMIVVMAPRISFSGIIASNDISTIFTGEGVDPQYDNKITSYINISEGRDLVPTDQNAVVLGIGLAAGMQAATGSMLTLLTSTRAGGLNAIDIQVEGIMQSGIKDYDNVFLKLPLQTVQKLLNTKAVTRLFVLIDKTENTELVAAKMKKLIQEKKLDLEIKTWDELATTFHAVVKILYDFFYFVAIIIILIVIFSITNTLTMSVMERIDEIGTIRAIGATKKNVMNFCRGNKEEL